MVGIVIVSHSFHIAEGVADLAREMGGPDVNLETAGGLDLPDHPIGTDAVMVMAAIERAWTTDGVLVLMDLGSAVLSAEMAVDLLPEEQRAHILLCEAPLVEGAVAAAVTAKMGRPLDAVAAEARGGLAGKIAHLGVPTPEGIDRANDGTNDKVGAAVVLQVTVRNEHGLHARPAARFVQTASGFEANVAVRDLTNGRGPADAASLNAVAMLGVATGHVIEISARGPRAGDVIAALQALAERDFDDVPEPLAPPPTSPAVARTDGALNGSPASPGIVIGPARRPHVADLEIPPAVASDPLREAVVLDTALDATRLDIEAQRARVARAAGEPAASIFDAHLLFLRDDALLAPARLSIQANGETAAQAWHDAIEHTAAGWDRLEDDYLRARATDLRSVGIQVLAHILGRPVPHPEISSPGILLANDLTPADTAGLDVALVHGIVTAHGGPTSHAAVLARSLGIPAVVGVGAALDQIEDGGSLAIDGGSGAVWIRPPEELVARLSAERDAAAARSAAAGALAAAPARTADGVLIEVAANIGRPEEAGPALAAGADGVGLFRTEFLFMGRDEMPTEDEQAEAYGRAADALAGRPLLLRTLDAGADKPIPFLHQAAEENPFLGVRGIRLGFERPELLNTQLRAIVRAAEGRHLRVMFPMVATHDELRRARASLDEARAAVGGDAAVEVGIMIEVPAAALTAASLAEDADFFSIGTNDLTQYTLAVDRGNERVASLTDALHPAVLRLIQVTVAGAAAHGRWVGVCGEIAGDPVATPLLLGLGVTELSMSIPAIADVKQAVRATDLVAARELAERAVRCTGAEEVRALLEDG